MDQTSQILHYMRRGNSINPMTALRLFSSMRLAARIKELKNKGISIHKQMMLSREGKRYARYWLA